MPNVTLCSVLAPVLLLLGSMTDDDDLFHPDLKGQGIHYVLAKANFKANFVANEISSRQDDKLNNFYVA